MESDSTGLANRADKVHSMAKVQVERNTRMGSGKEDQRVRVSMILSYVTSISLSVGLRLKTGD